jgi:hypothetical protein
MAVVKAFSTPQRLTTAQVMDFHAFGPGDAKIARMSCCSYGRNISKPPWVDVEAIKTSSCDFRPALAHL